MDTSIDWEFIVSASSNHEEHEESLSRENSLIKAAASGDENAFRVLVERYQDQVYRFAYQWLGNTEDAHEACQDTFVKAYLAIGRYRRKGKFSTWLYRIAWNLCRDRTRSRAHRDRSQTHSIDEFAFDTNIECGGSSPDTSAERKEQLRELLQVIDNLPDRFRGVVILCCFEGLSHEEAAEVLNCSVRGVEGRLYRARKLISTGLNPDSDSQ